MNPVQLRNPEDHFPIRPYSKAELRDMYGVTADVFRKYYLGDPETMAELKTLGYKNTSKYLTRQMVKVIIKYHDVP